MQLYEHQTRAVEALRDNIRKGRKRQILCAPTGSGKTVIATHLMAEARRKGSKAVFLCDRIALIDQTSAMFDAHGIEHGVIQANHWRYRPWAKIQIASVQTIARRQWPEDLNLIVVDEAHTIHDVTRQRILKDDVIVVGLTATPFTKGLGSLYQDVVSVTTTYKLIDDGKLARFEVYAPSEPDMTGAKTSMGEWTSSEAASRSMPIIGDVVEQYVRHALGRKFICFGATIAHCEALHRQFFSSGIRTELYTARTPDEERTEILTEFRKPNSSISGLISVAALAKGFDAPDVSCVIIARPLKSSLAEHIQIIGRGLRADPQDPDKHCIILDHAGNWMRFADDTEAFFRESIHELTDEEVHAQQKVDREKEETWRKCHSCAHVHRLAPMCPRCGFEYPKRDIVHQEGQLARLGDAASHSYDIRRSWYQQLLGIAMQRGYKDGWAAHVYRAKFRAWPTRSWSDATEKPTQEVINYITHRNIRRAKARR